MLIKTVCQSLDTFCDLKVDRRQSGNVFKPHKQEEMQLNESKSYRELSPNETVLVQTEVV